MTTPSDHDPDLRGILGAPREFTSSQVSERVGIPTYRARRYWRALGFANVLDGHKRSAAPPVAWRGLVERTPVPLFQGRESRRTVLHQTWGLQTPNPTTFAPLLTTSDNKPLAAIYSHPDIVEVCWPS